MQYRKLKIGEIIRPTDQYLSCFSHRWKRTDNLSIGNKINKNHLPFRRPIKSKINKKSTLCPQCDHGHKSYLLGIVRSFNKLMG
jgi:hypothetical protein